MGFNWDSYVVRAPDEAALAAVKAADPKAIALPGGFARVRWDSSADWTRSGNTIPWSQRFGEAWFFCATSASGVFAYEHGREGKVLRSLGFYPDEGWVSVEGDAEPWEDVLFRPDQLDRCRRAAADAPGDARWPGELQALQSRRLVVGNLFPVADPELVQYVAQQLGTRLVR